MHQPGSNVRPTRPRGPLLRIGGLVLVFATVSVAAYRLGWFDPQRALEHIVRSRHSQSLPVFTTSFVVTSGLGMAIGLPGMPFVVAAGALYGTFLGSVLGWMASMIGSVVGYLIARTVGHDVVLRWVSRFPRVNAAVAECRDFTGVLRLRLVPVLPIGTVNFVAGLARAPLAVYGAATAIGIVPATLIYAYFADSLLEGVGNGKREAFKSLIIASVLLLGFSLTPTVARRLKKRDTLKRAERRTISRARPSHRS